MDGNDLQNIFEVVGLPASDGVRIRSWCVLFIFVIFIIRLPVPILRVFLRSCSGNGRFMILSRSRWDHAVMFKARRIAMRRNPSDLHSRILHPIAKRMTSTTAWYASYQECSYHITSKARFKLILFAVGIWVTQALTDPLPSAFVHLSWALLTLGHSLLLYRLGAGHIAALVTSLPWVRCYTSDVSDSVSALGTVLHDKEAQEVQCLRPCQIVRAARGRCRLLRTHGCHFRSNQRVARRPSAI